MVASALGGPALSAERDRIQRELRDVHQRFEGVRRFIEQGDGSAKVRQWLTGLEREETRLDAALAALEARPTGRPSGCIRGRPRPTWPTSARRWSKGAPEPDRLCRKTSSGVVHPVRPKAAKPFTRVEVITSGEGLLGGV
jgi:hypothetical protein